MGSERLNEKALWDQLDGDGAEERGAEADVLLQRMRQRELIWRNEERGRVCSFYTCFPGRSC